jgi:hypothetical protein
MVDLFGSFQACGYSLRSAGRYIHFRDRWRATLDAWPGPVARAFRSHLRSVKRMGGSVATLPPYWIAFAEALARREKLSPRRLEDVLWATTCLAHALRIEDDLLDDDAPVDLAVFAPALLYGEADRTLARHFPHRSPFWSDYRRLIRITIEAIARASDLQQRRTGNPALLARLYIRECALFTIPLVAICRLAGTRQALRRIVAAAEHCAVVGHAIDDLQDVDRDLASHRVNLAAAFLLDKPPARNVADDTLRTRVASQILFSRRLSAFFVFLHGHLAAADDSVVALHLSAAHRYIRMYRSALLTWEEALQHERRASVVRLLQSR